MRTGWLAAAAALLLVVVLIPLTNSLEVAEMEAFAQKTVDLPEPKHDSQTAIEQALLERRSKRSFTQASLSLAGISQLCWAAQGVTSRRGFRTAPSAGALYPLEVFVAAAEVDGLDPGIYRYLPGTHQLVRESRGDRADALWKAALHQSAVKQAPAVFVFTAVFERTMEKYGQRGKPYALMEAGHAAQNLCLQTVSLGLATVPIGAFDDSAVASVLGLKQGTRPLYLMPVGRPD